MTDDVKALVERAKRETHTFGRCGAKSCDAMIAALTAQAEEIERLRKLTRPQWFYYGDECSSDQCRDSVHECIDEDFLWGNKAEGSHVLEISTATNLPTIWALVRFFTEEEKNARDSDDDYEVTEFASEDEASAALKAAQEVKA